MKRVQELLEQIGLEPERVQMFNMSSAMAGQFVTSTQEMISKVEKLGLNPLRKSELQENELLEERNSLENKSLSSESEVSK